MVNSSWKDYETHGRRLSKILKILDKKFDRIPKDDIDGLARIAATIGNITNHIVNLIKIVDLYDEISAKHKEDMKEVRQQESILKKWKSEELQRKKESIQHQIEQEKRIKHSEEVSRQSAIEFQKRCAREERRHKEQEEMEL